jgi:3-oxoacyl-[acyl-carrier-protein] synthase II
MAYINGIGIISPQKTAETTEFLTEVMEYTADYLKCIEPVYRGYIDPILGRRMSRLIKMGITSAKLCMEDAGCKIQDAGYRMQDDVKVVPDAIITGTGLGSVEDTEKILGDLTKEEKFLNPTPFIQSTYNTISSQIAINFKCHGYNATYVHRTFSFESGLLDALMQIEEKMAENVLVGGIDEMTQNHLVITRRTGMWKMEPVNNLQLLENNASGALAGEGSAYFSLGSKPGPNVYARLKDVSNQFSLDGKFDPSLFIPGFLEKNGLQPGDIDLVLLGLNGDPKYDPRYTHFAGKLFPNTAWAWYKHLCGEYHTASGFGLWTAANIIKRQSYPEILRLNSLIPSPIRNILIYNQFRNTNHSFMLVQKAGEYVTRDA